MLKVSRFARRTSVPLALLAALALPACGGGDDDPEECPDGQVLDADSGECVAEVVDGDNDGVPVNEDCDDADPNVGSNANDLDCDGVPTALDCDDEDAAAGSSADDADCDGVATAMDCDDTDAAVGSNADDMDCDGVATAMDCDDTDANIGSSADDMDCDGVPTAMDCDDTDANIGANDGDMDCDGVPAADDCDDTDDTLGAVADDSDCDGVINANDECPDDPNFSTAPAPQVGLRFPSEVSATNATSLTVSGSITVFCGNTLEGASADVNGAMMTLATTDAGGGVATWSFSTNLVEDSVNAIRISADDSNTRTGTLDVAIEQYNNPEAPPTEALGSSQGIAFDAANNMAYVSDEALPGVYAVNLTTGITTILSGPANGAGPAFDPDLEGGIALDAPNNRVLVTDDGANVVFAVDLTTGDRSIVSDSNDMGTPFGIIYGIAVDSANNRAYVADSGIDGVFAVDLATGDRTIVTAVGSVGTGPDITTPRDVDIDLANNRLLVVGTGADALVGVDIATGNRVELSGSSVGTGPDFSSIRGVSFDAANNRALIAEAGNGFEGIVAVDLASGDRTEISGQNVGTTIDLGADFDSTRGVVFDAANNRFLAVDDQITALVSVDPATGDRTLVVPPTPAPPNVGSGPSFIDPTGLVYDQANGALYVADDGLDGIVRVNLGDGVRSTIADGSSAGVTLDEPRGLGWDPANNRLLVPDNASDLDAVIGVDIATGEGAIISGDDSPDDMSTTFASPRGRVAVEPGGTTALVADTARDILFRIDLMTGERTTLVESSVELAGIQSVAVDGDNNRALVTAASTGNDDTLDALIAVDLTDGSLTVLANRDTDVPAVGSGVVMTNPRGFDLDLANGRAIVFDADLDAIIAVDLTSLERTVVSSASVGNGDMLGLDGNNTNAVEISSARNVAFAVNEGNNQVFLIDLMSGDQVVISR